MHATASWLGLVAALAAVVSASVACGAGSGPETSAVAVTGAPVPGLQPFDATMTTYMAARGIPGGQLAVSRDGKIVLSHGYGWADKDARRPVEPRSLFRIASLTKPITAVAVLRLLQHSGGSVTLDTPVFSLLHYRPHLPPGRTEDPRLARITIHELLQHTAGWDSGETFDPMFRSVRIARAMGVAPPARPADIIRYMLGFPLCHDPGAKYVYSNFGYCVLGRVIEKLSGMSYEAYVRAHVLAPLGITDMRIGHTLASQAAPGEVHYYDPATGPSVFHPDSGRRVPAPYGTFCLEAMDSHGGWIASAQDLVRFACAFDDPAHCPLLDAASVATMWARPPGKPGQNPDGWYYACGWCVRPTSDGKANEWHVGSLPGSFGLLVRRHDGLNWCALFNMRTATSDEIDPALHRAANASHFEAPKPNLAVGVSQERPPAPRR